VKLHKRLIKRHEIRIVPRLHFRFVADGATGAPLLLRLPTRSEQKPGGGPQPPVNVPVVRESSSELVIDRSLASRAVRMQLTGPACLGKTPARSDCPVALVLARRRGARSSGRVSELL
jgi:hypothetical protein